MCFGVINVQKTALVVSLRRLVGAALEVSLKGWLGRVILQFGPLASVRGNSDFENEEIFNFF